MNNDAWPLVSVLFITYKRCDLLEQSICAFRENTDCLGYPVREACFDHFSVFIAREPGSTARV